MYDKLLKYVHTTHIHIILHSTVVHTTHDINEKIKYIFVKTYILYINSCSQCVTNDFGPKL